MTRTVPIDFGATGEAEVIQNVRMIVSTVVGSVPLDRGFGIDPASLDQPIQIARALLASEIVLKVRQLEPRAEVTQVDFSEDHESGKLVPLIMIEEVTI